MLLYTLLAIAAIVVFFLAGRTVLRALRAFVKSCWPQS
jgi:hypothetical protein